MMEKSKSSVVSFWELFEQLRFDLKRIVNLRRLYPCRGSRLL
jgi:hypothetical protein